jgi:hypothetical protein
MMSTKDCSNELDWTAFCYAAGELSPAEGAAFEQRLATDQAAREALARAVELTQAVAMAETLEPVVVVRAERSLWGRRLAWMAVGSAASLLAAALVSALVAPRADNPLVVSDDLTSELAAAWTQTRQELSVASDAGLWFPDHLDAVTLDTVTGEPVDPLTDEREDAVVSATPSWLTAAVRSSAGLPVDADATPFDDDRGDN